MKTAPTSEGYTLIKLVTLELPMNATHFYLILAEYIHLCLVPHRQKPCDSSLTA